MYDTERGERDKGGLQGKRERKRADTEQMVGGGERWRRYHGAHKGP